MSFKISAQNINTGIKTQSEIITGESNLSTKVQNSFLKRGSYSVYLPKGHAGQIKIIQITDVTNTGTVNVSFPNAEDGHLYTQNLSNMGDTIFLIGSPIGWHIYPRIGWY